MRKGIFPRMSEASSEGLTKKYRAPQDWGPCHVYLWHKCNGTGRNLQEPLAYAPESFA